jgi:Ca2+-binding RTX toxin-like protein
MDLGRIWLPRDPQFAAKLRPVYCTGSSNSTLDGSAGSGDVFGVSGGGNNSLIGSTGDDQFYITGNGANTVTGGGGNDLVAISGTGADSVTLGNGNDSVFAGAGAETISAGNGNNELVAGSGANQSLSAGTGNDLFVFVTGVPGQPNSGTGSTMSGGGGSDSVLMVGLNTNQLVGQTPVAGGGTLVTFSDGRTLAVQNIHTLHFGNGDVTV